MKPFSVVMPCSSVEARTCEALVHSVLPLAAKGLHLNFLTCQDCSEVVAARNASIHRFLSQPPEVAGDRMVFLDSDIAFHWSALYHVAVQTEDVVGAVYARKTIDPDRLKRAISLGLKKPLTAASELMFRSLEEGRGGAQKLTCGPDSSRLVEVERLPTGFLSLSRACLMRMVDASEPYVIDSGEVEHAVFRALVKNGRRVGEDYDFCDRWRELGGKVWLTLNVRLGHVGKNVFWGDLNEVFPNYEQALMSEGGAA